MNMNLGGSSSSGSKTMLHLWAIALMDMTAVSVLLPSYRDMFEQRGLTLTDQGWCSSAFSLLVFFGAPTWSSLSDRMGRVS